MNEELLKKKTKEICDMLKDAGIDYLDICFLEGDTIMITDIEKTKISSLDGGQTWQKR